MEATAEGDVLASCDTLTLVPITGLNEGTTMNLKTIKLEATSENESDFPNWHVLMPSDAETLVTKVESIQGEGTTVHTIKLEAPSENDSDFPNFYVLISSDSETLVPKFESIFEEGPTVNSQTPKLEAPLENDADFPNFQVLISSDAETLVPKFESIFEEGPTVTSQTPQLEAASENDSDFPNFHVLISSDAETLVSKFESIFEEGPTVNSQTPKLESAWENEPDFPNCHALISSDTDTLVPKLDSTIDCDEDELDSTDSSSYISLSGSVKWELVSENASNFTNSDSSASCEEECNSRNSTTDDAPHTNSAIIMNSHSWSTSGEEDSNEVKNQKSENESDNTTSHSWSKCDEEDNDSENNIIIDQVVDIKSKNRNPKKRKSKVNHNKLQFECHLCQSSFSTRKGMESHLLTVHDSGTSAFTCDVCHIKCPNAYKLNRHRLVHSKAKPFKCPHCSYATQLNFNLKNHLAVVHNLGPARFPCKICGQRCFSKHKLMDHMRSHLQEKPLKCDRCEDVFVRKDALDIHLLIMHGVGECRFICKVCKRRCASKGALIMHQRNCKGVFKCPHCPYATKVERSLRRHLVSCDAADDAGLPVEPTIRRKGRKEEIEIPIVD